MTEKQKKSPQQRAQEALDVAERRVERLEKHRDKLRSESNRAQAEYERAVQARDYAAKHPDLPRDEPEPEQYVEPDDSSKKPAPEPEF